jgi:polysaccharide biosynthesis protein PelA
MLKLTHAYVLLGLAPALVLATVRPLECSQEKVRRDVLALFDSSSEPEPHLTKIHQYLEMPLNHLGFRLAYSDVLRGPPDASIVTSVRAIIIWLKGSTALRDEISDWITIASEAGVRLVVIGEIGSWATGNPAAARLLRRLGLRYEGYEIAATYNARITRADEIITAAERKLQPPLAPFPAIVQESDAITPHLAVLHSRGRASRENILVATGPGGGFVAENYGVAYDSRTDRQQWLIDPFEFLRRALLADGENIPIPDVTTISGRRLYFSHIDGDGWNNISNLVGYRDKQLSAAEVVLRELIAPYPALPVTVGFVAADGDPVYGGHRPAQQIASDIFKLPQVAVGSHTYTHPYNWKFFENYDPAQEEALGSATPFARANASVTERGRPAGTIGSDPLPRAYTQQPFELSREIAGALSFSASLAPPGKKPMLYQWSGDARPFEAAVRMTRNLGVKNINGGDGRLDYRYPSLTYLPPIARVVGKERQIYAVNSNDYTYFEESGQDHAFLMLEETLRNTEWPMRLRGFNLYYHMYVGERLAYVNAVRHFLGLAERGPYIPIHASHYAGIADSFFSAEIWTEGSNRWSIRDRGEIETIRLDRTPETALDLAESIGVLGMTAHGESLYIALDPAVDQPVLALRSADQEAPARLPYLKESRWRLSSLAVEPSHLAFVAAGFGPGQMTWQGLLPGRYRLSAGRAGKLIWQSHADADADGRMSLTIEASALEPIEVAFELIRAPEQ